MSLKLIHTLLSEKPGIKSVFVALMGLSLLLIFFNQNHEVFAANGRIIFEQKQYWKAFTTSFLHADLQHLGSNSIFFVILAMLLNHYFGWLVFPVMSIIAGGVINLIVFKIYPPEVLLVGASGIVYFMAGFWLTMYVLVERKIKPGRRLMNCIAIALIFLFPEVFQPKTSYLAHAVGFIMAIPSALFFFLFKRKGIRAREVWQEIPPPPEFELESTDILNDTL